MCQITDVFMYKIFRSPLRVFTLPDGIFFEFSEILLLKFWANRQTFTFCGKVFSNFFLWHLIAGIILHSLKMPVTGSTSDIQAFALFAEFVAKEAGETIRRAIVMEKTFDLKSSVVDLVTETDKAVETFIINSLKERYPDHQFIGEESVAGGLKVNLTDAPTWIIDPIDGTTNFVHTFPYVAVSIGLSINKELVAGIIYHVMADEMYTAVVGHGAFCNGLPIKVTHATTLQGALVITEVGAARDPLRMDCFYKNFKAVLSTNAHGIRALGSAALNLCMVAKGAGDINYEYGIHCWDVAAGAVIVREAGGHVCDPTGGDFDQMARRVVAGATREITKELCGILSHPDLERD